MNALTFLRPFQRSLLVTSATGVAARDVRDFAADSLVQLPSANWHTNGGKFRIEGNRIIEHWDVAAKARPAPRNRGPLGP